MPSLDTTDPLADAIHSMLNQYFMDLEGEQCHRVYEMVLTRVEKPLLDIILQQAAGNQSRAAEMLGINRNTLRKKMQQHGFL